MEIGSFIEKSNLDTAFGMYLHKNKESLSKSLQQSFDNVVAENNLSEESLLTLSQFESIFAKMQVEGIKLTIKIVTEVLGEYLSSKD